MGALHQAIVDLRKLVGEQAEGHVDALNVGVLRPAKEADQVRARAASQAAQLAGRHQVLGIVEDDGEARPILVLFEQGPLDELIQPKKHNVGVARPGGRFSQRGRQPPHHAL